MEIDINRYQEIRALVAGCIYLLGSSDPFKICKLLDIKIQTVPLSLGLYGFSDVCSNSGYTKASIFLSDKLTSYARKIVCAHELGHILSHKKDRLNLFDLENPVDSIAEYEANIFAIELMPQIYRGHKNYLDLSCSELANYMDEKIKSTYMISL